MSDDSADYGHSVRTKPGQALESNQFIYAPAPQWDYHIASYAFREWISTAINRIAEMAMASPVLVRSRGGDRVLDNHPLLDLIGMYGQPNESQDSLEFLEGHFPAV